MQACHIKAEVILQSEDQCVLATFLKNGIDAVGFNVLGFKFAL